MAGSQQKEAWVITGYLGAPLLRRHKLKNPKSFFVDQRSEDGGILADPRRLTTELLSVDPGVPLKIHLPRILHSSWEEIDL